jgi:hypothetical protein
VSARIKKKAELFFIIIIPALLTRLGANVAGGRAQKFFGGVGYVYEYRSSAFVIESRTGLANTVAGSADSF